MGPYLPPPDAGPASDRAPFEGFDPLTDEPGASSPPAWLIGNIQPFHVGRAFLQLVLLVAVGIVLVVLFNGGDR